MALLLDEAHWHWRGRMWCHLVSDHSLAELHAFAEWIGMPRRAFQGDHYDIPEEARPIAIEAETCGEPNAYWDPQKRRVALCYELLAFHADLALRP